MKLKNKKITVMGLGIHGGGEGLVRYLSNKGAKILVTDVKQEDELKKTLNNLKNLQGVEYHFGGHTWSDFKNADIVFLNPAIPKNSLWVKRIQEAKIPISSEMNLFIERCKGKIIGVTGTNGKSTTANLIFEILKNKFQPLSSIIENEKNQENYEKKVYFGGNIGGSLLNYLDEITKNDIVLLELSSFQLFDFSTIKKSPHISVILNITPDHLDSHSDFKEYIEAKINIVRFQERSDFAILNYDSEIVRKISQKIISKVLYFSSKSRINRGAYIENKEIWVNFRGKKYKIMPTKDNKLIGSHNLENILAAILVGTLYNIKPFEIQKAVSQFKGLPHRIEWVKEIKGITFFNDSKSTTPESTIAALNSFQKPLILIAGGKEKGFDFSNLIKTIIKKVKNLILIGEIADRIEKDIKKQKNIENNPILQNIYNTENIKNAVLKAKKIAKKGDVVLLSPATSSFDQFKSFEERGEIFKRLVGGR